MSYELLLLVSAACAWYLSGLCLFVQIVHYPLFEFVDRARFISFESQHTRRTGYVVALPMLLELLFGVWLVFAAPQHQVSLALIAQAALLGVVWVSTFAFQVPCHAVLARGFDAPAHLRLVRSNWVRTIAWLARAIVLLWLIIEQWSATSPVTSF